MSSRLAEVLEKNGMSQSEAARIAGVDKSLISRVVAGEYKGWHDKEQAIIDALGDAGKQIEFEALQRYGVDQTQFIVTANVKAFNELADDLLQNPNLTSSLGVAKGTAGRGKTASAKHYVATRNNESIYVLYVDGYSNTMLARQIAYEMTGVKARSFSDNIDLISEATRLFRRLVVIDEADKMPGRYLEMLRSLNERCELPMLLVGEETLYQRMAEEPRRLSRVRKPIVNFSMVTRVDIALFYERAVGISISETPQVLQHLLERSRGDFRLVVSDAMAICNVLNASGINTITMEVIKSI